MPIGGSGGADKDIVILVNKKGRPQPVEQETPQPAEDNEKQVKSESEKAQSKQDNSNSSANNQSQINSQNSKAPSKVAWASSSDADNQKPAKIAWASEIPNQDDDHNIKLLKNKTSNIPWMSEETAPAQQQQSKHSFVKANSLTSSSPPQHSFSPDTGDKVYVNPNELQNQQR